MQTKPAYLILANGMVFGGQSFGYMADATGEIVFTTAMTGYLETLTDPSYFGQIVIQTFPLIGNYGVITPDFESSKPALSAYIVRDLCQEPSNFRSEGALDVFLRDNHIVGLADIDTRKLTRIVREVGVMNAKITHTLPEDLTETLAELNKFTIKNAVESVTCKEPETFTPESKKRRVVLWDFGAKANIRRELVNRGCEVIVMPAHSTAEDILAQNPDGIMLSNGPGDPSANTGVIAELKKLMEHKLPTFGICLGHQLLALSQGAKTEKLKYGHRGANQPAIRMSDKRVFITSQNHGYAVIGDSLPSTAEVSYINGNDGTCEGVDYKDMPAFTVQFHPEASAGPLDTQFLFDRFINLMEVN
ncbi:MAG: glutamine-hydrolyzing carbamoyl-phosphate synthase small subunit [Clostridiales bacterium]|nr:glutamine-hydrolyzing carbamoyl-phosphate synthase small subunit [Clostridiales bacterium]